MSKSQNGPDTTIDLDHVTVPADIVLPLQALLIGRLHERLLAITEFDVNRLRHEDAPRSLDADKLRALAELLDGAQDLVAALYGLRPDAERPRFENTDT